MKMIIICATGRSGSTTLQRILNTIEDSNITGEKLGAIENLLECYHNIKNTNNCTPKSEDGLFLTSDECEIKKIKPCFYNCYDFEKVKNNIKNTIISILTKDDSERVIGYKEIRLCHRLYLIDEFIELFPNTKVILHIDDNLNRQCNSGWWKENPNSKKILREANKKIIEYARKCNKAYLSYMKYLFNINKMKKLFTFLEENFDQKQYDEIIKNNLKD